MIFGSEPAETKLKVLFVDDEPNLLRAYERLFRKHIDLSTAVGAQEGLAMLRHESFDVIISDRRMPGMDGVAFLEKAREISPNSVLILLSGNPTSDEDSVAFRCLQKPCPRAEVLAVLEESRLELARRAQEMAGCAPESLVASNNHRE